MRLTFWIGSCVVLLDQATKYLVVDWLDRLGQPRIDVLPPFLVFRKGLNSGVNFGLGAGLELRWLLVAVALAISGLVLWWVWRDRGGRGMQISAGFLVGGALANVIDRVRIGAVIDFLNMSCCGIENPYIFNIADIAVFAGAIGLMIFGGDAKPPAAGKVRKKPA